MLLHVSPATTLLALQRFGQKAKITTKPTPIWLSPCCLLLGTQHACATAWVPVEPSGLTWHCTQLNDMQLGHHLPILERFLCKADDCAGRITASKLQTHNTKRKA